MSLNVSKCLEMSTLMVQNFIFLNFKKVSNFVKKHVILLEKCKMLCSWIILCRSLHLH